jgi:ketosteroid isomerase-like protein
MAGSGEETVRRAYEVINRSESVDAAMTDLDELMHPDIEFVNPEDAIEGGTRKGLAGMRTAFENFFDGAGRAATVEVEEVREHGERVFVRARIHARGASSGAAVVGPPVGRFTRSVTGESSGSSGTRTLKRPWPSSSEAADGATNRP